MAKQKGKLHWNMCILDKQKENKPFKENLSKAQAFLSVKYSGFFHIELELTQMLKFWMKGIFNWSVLH